MPTLTIFAGMNGAGKSTLYHFQKSIFEPGLGVRICPDEILQQNNGDWQNFAHQVKASKLALEKMNNCLDRGVSFNWETTIMGNFALNLITRAKALGYTINLNFLGVSKIEKSFKRIEYRVKNGGHGIPEKIVRHRFEHQFDNMGKVLSMVDRAMLYDNSSTLQIVGSYSQKTLRIFNNAIPWTKEIVRQHQEYKNAPTRD